MEDTFSGLLDHRIGAMSSPLATALGGIPFVDRGFDQDLLVALVMRKRQRLLGSVPPLGNLLAPGPGAAVMAGGAARSVQERWGRLPDLSFSEAERVAKAKARIAGHVADWRGLFELPVRLVKAADARVVSASNPVVPQTIALGPKSFATDARLIESLIHEYAHVWLGLICELQDLQAPRSTVQFSLPSGTPGKSVRTVLFAGHFATACATYFGPSATVGDSALPFAAYAKGCVRSIGSGGLGDLTDAGRFVLSRLIEASRRWDESC